MPNDLQVQIVPNDTAWDEVLSLNGTVFHYSEWINCVTSAFGGNASKITVSLNGRILAAFSVFQGGKWANGTDFRVGAIGYGGPVAIDPCDIEQCSSPAFLRKAILALQEFLAGSCVGVRGIPIAPELRCPDLKYGVTHILPLSKPTPEIFETWIEGSIRTAIRKARKSTVQVRQVPAEEYERAHALIEATQRAVGSSYTTPKAFVERILTLSTSITPLLIGAYLGEELCACSVFLLSKRGTFHLFNGWNREYAPLCPNQLLLWEAIEIASDNRSPALNFGESGYESLAIAKAKWGGDARYVLHLNQTELRQLILTVR